MAAALPREDRRRRGHPVLAPSRRTFRCLLCKAPVPMKTAFETGGACIRCVTTNLGWHEVYDRDRRFGAIPENLKRAYGLR